MVDIDIIEELKRKEQVKLHIWLPAEQHQAVKIAAANEGESMTAVIQSAIHYWLTVVYPSKASK